MNDARDGYLSKYYYIGTLINKNKEENMTAMNNDKILLPLPKELDDLLDTWVTGFAGYMKVCELPPKIMEIAKNTMLTV